MAWARRLRSRRMTTLLTHNLKDYLGVPNLLVLSGS